MNTKILLAAAILLVAIHANAQMGRAPGNDTARNLTVLGNAGILGTCTTGSIDATHAKMETLNITQTATIGTAHTSFTTPAGYNLYVSKGILTEKLKVANSADVMNWSDFVFNKDYKLRSLHDVESYINANKHLPEIPSAKEVGEEGIDVAAMDARLLQKIEELTLYIIQQQKEIDELKKQGKH